MNEDREFAQAVQPGMIGDLGPGVVAAHIAQPARDRIVAESAELGGPSPLLRYHDVPEAGIEITKAHPGSLPQFITGRSTLLSGLFRDEVAMRTARIAAEQITAKNIELRAVRGIDSVHLATGLASWRIGGVEYTAPVLLRPLGIRRHFNDYELKLHGPMFVNPELVRAMREHYAITIDGARLAALAHEGGIFKPQRVIDELRRLTTRIDTFAVHPRLIVSTFADVSAHMAADGRLDHPILNALAGHADDRDFLKQQRPIAAWAGPDDRSPAADTLLLDADAEQERVLSRIVAGQSLAVATLPGTGGTQTIINAVGALVQAGKRVLVVSTRRSTLDGLRHRLVGIGLDGLAVRTTNLQEDLIRAIGRNEKAAQPAVAEVDEALVSLRAVLRDYRAALTQKHPAFNVSAIDATRELAKIAQHPEPPKTQARLDARALAALSKDRTEAAEKLTLAAKLGEFEFGPDDSPWYGASFESTAAAQATHELAGKLNKTEVPNLLERGYALIAQTRMRPFLTVDELGEYLKLLQGMLESLDKFSPTVFERPLTDLIAAHATRRDGVQMSGAQRRRLKAVAREYVRPGVHVQDMHAALVRIQKQRTAWQRYVDQGVVPEIPAGLQDVAVAWQRVHADLGALDKPLGRAGAAQLSALPVAQLVRTLAGLAAESTFFDNLIERSKLRVELAKMGLEPLLSDLSERHVPEHRVAAELESAWWLSAIEHLLQTDKALLGARTSVVDSLERDFRLVDEAHNANSGPLLAWRLATDWRIALIDQPAEAQALRTAITRGGLTPAALRAAAPTLARVLVPVWVASPYDVPRIPDTDFDVVLIADAGAINTAEAAPAIRRARQVVLFGDPVTQAPTPFDIATTTSGEWESEHEFDTTSVFERVAELVPVETLTRSYRVGGEDLAELVNDAFYGGEIVSMPWAGSYLGRGSLTVDYVEGGVGAPDPVSGAVESPEAEVQRVATVVVEHAVNRPKESLMVVTASRKHAERVRVAVAHALAGRADVADFVSRDNGEPFAVLTLEESVAESRDRVIFSLGYGLTRHGRVLSDFGDLSTPDGERLLTVGMTRARRSMTVVSSIRPTAFTDDRLEYGAATLMTILSGIAERSRETHLEDLADPLMLQLARELRALGVTLNVNYRGVLPLVAQHNGRAVVVESDPEIYGDSLRESLRLRPQALRKLGWHYVRVHSFDLYSDPGRVASRIAALLGAIPFADTEAAEDAS